MACLSIRKGKKDKNLISVFVGFSGDSIWNSEQKTTKA
jgi:hypothetical protein